MMMVALFKTAQWVYENKIATTSLINSRVVGLETYLKWGTVWGNCLVALSLHIIDMIVSMYF